ncbi:hypothetical protein C0989_002681 [Termitomyces sp. Mn162]|nr:hypothetical protein C0989_002681 [Termitomyces sp. Mn162]
MTVYYRMTFHRDSQIQAQLDVLNMDYAESGVKWNLVNTTRIQSQEWFDSVAPDSPENAALKSVFRYGNESTLNVYTVGFVKNVEAQGLLGYSTFPADYKSNPKDDGVVIRYSSLPNGTAAPFNLGRTLTHEVGHWVGLYHTFQMTPGGFKITDAPNPTWTYGEKVGATPQGREWLDGEEAGWKTVDTSKVEDPRFTSKLLASEKVLLAWSASTDERVQKLLQAIDIPIPETGETGTTLILGTIKYIHVRKDVLDERGNVDPGKLKPVARMGGTLYAKVNEGYNIYRPNWKEHGEPIRETTDAIMKSEL